MISVFGLIGHPVSHSFSKGFFEKKFERENIKDCRYDMFDLKSIQDVIDLKKNPYLKGLNVTVPYKKSIIPLLDFISEEAIKIGAVNTIKITDGKWFGYNTDVIGFEKSLVPLLSPAIKNALILGTGGASLAVRYVLEKLGISFSFVSRNIENADYRYKDLSESVLNTHQLIINTTPLGMFPDINKMPEIPLKYLTLNHLVCDLIYNPEETFLLKNAAFAGCQIKNGLEMLHIQAEESWKIWTAY
jgi:shikimate dehydrogenase